MNKKSCVYLIKRSGLVRELDQKVRECEPTEIILTILRERRSEYEVNYK